MILLGCLFDIAFGWPDALFRRIGHPVTWIGALIDWCEHRLNHGADQRRRRNGAVTTAIAVSLAVSSWGIAMALLPDGWRGVVLGGLLAWPLIALRSMHDHVAAVAAPLAKGDIANARTEVAKIVGRNPEQLDEAGIARSALESLAENTSDGIVAPVFWGVVAGLPGIAAYKAINTLDSMIGHRSDRYEQFGKVAARLDDLVNLIPARLTAALFAIVSQHPRVSWNAMLRDARQHRSPNAGWPEAAMAGGLSVRLSGPRVYEDRISKEPWLNLNAPDPTPDDLGRGLGIYRRAMAMMILGLLGLAILGI